MPSHTRIAYLPLFESILQHVSNHLLLGESLRNRDLLHMTMQKQLRLTSCRQEAIRTASDNLHVITQTVDTCAEWAVRLVVGSTGSCSSGHEETELEFP